MSNIRISLYRYQLITWLLWLCSSLLWSQQTLCVGSVANYRVDFSENNGQGTIGSTYQWVVISANFQGSITPITSSGNQIQIDWSTTPAGTYALKVTETNQSNCVSEQQLTVFLKALPSVQLTDQQVCLDPLTGTWANQVVFFTGFNTTQFSFEWFLNGQLLAHQGSFLQAQNPGEYTVKITNNQTGCFTTATATVTAIPTFTATGTIGNAFENVQTIQIQVNGGVGPFVYSINGGAFQSSNTFTVTGAGQQTVEIKDENGCDIIQTVVLTALNYPKYFTPNNDGVNDQWTIQGLANQPDNKIYIFDRYGKLITQIFPPFQAWDGTFQGQPLPATDYWFVLEYMDTNNEKQTFKSHFSLLR